MGEARSEANRVVRAYSFQAILKWLRGWRLKYVKLGNVAKGTIAEDKRGRIYKPTCDS